MSACTVRAARREQTALSLGVLMCRDGSKQLPALRPALQQGWRRWSRADSRSGCWCVQLRDCQYCRSGGTATSATRSGHCGERMRRVCRALHALPSALLSPLRPAQIYALPGLELVSNAPVALLAGWQGHMASGDGTGPPPTWSTAAFVCSCRGDVVLLHPQLELLRLGLASGGQTMWASGTHSTAAD